MSHLRIDVSIAAEEIHRVWAPEIVRRLRAVAEMIEHATGAIAVKLDWPDLEAWPQPSPPQPDTPLDSRPFLPRRVLRRAGRDAPGAHASRAPGAFRLPMLECVLQTNHRLD
jgi:hypothetical protein